jgi:hypothetical protein
MYIAYHNLINTYEQVHINVTYDMFTINCHLHDIPRVIKLKWHYLKIVNQPPSLIKKEKKRKKHINTTDQISIKNSIKLQFPHWHGLLDTFIIQISHF